MKTHFSDSVFLKVVLDCILSFSSSNNSFFLPVSARCSSSFPSSMMRLRHSFANIASYVGVLTVASLTSRTLFLPPIISSNVYVCSANSCFFPLAKKAILNDLIILFRIKLKRNSNIYFSMYRDHL